MAIPHYSDNQKFQISNYNKTVRKLNFDIIQIMCP